jgi:hypothetical protein
MVPIYINVPANGAGLSELGDAELADDVAVGNALVDRRRARSVQTDRAVQDVHQYCGSHFRHCSSKRS